MSQFPLPFAFSRDHLVLASQEPQGLALLFADSTPLSAINEVQRHYSVVRFERLAPEALRERIGAAYAQGDGNAAAVIGEVESDMDLSRLMQAIPAVEDLLEAADDAPIIRMLNALFTQASRDGASDIHIEPFEQTSVVRFRVDGALRDVVRPNKALHAALISRIKIMSELDIAEKRLPQDGRISLRIGGRPVDVRVSTLPAAHGERAVMRLLDKSDAKLDLAKIGMGPEMLKRFEKLIAQPHGIILVTGPTGSGKTTTLYSAMAKLDVSQGNIMTVEDPIEYELPGIAQTQVNPKIELTFAKSLRAILRQDPDVIMIGEIRDFETAQIAIQASLTGHLVLATLHTNDAPSAVTRLTDMGIEPFLLSSSLLGVLAQRLVRKLCPYCAKQEGHAAAAVPVMPIAGAEDLAALDGVTRWHPVGCAQCSSTGYSGRTGVFELLEVNDQIRSLIHSKSSESEVRDTAQFGSMRSMRDDGLRYVREGATSLEELLRVTRD
jgi:general secretion pathway protein E